MAEFTHSGDDPEGIFPAIPGHEGAGVVIDQRASDQFLDLLRPETLAEAMVARRQPGQLRMQTEYDHSCFFVSSFAADHVGWHATRLLR